MYEEIVQMLDEAVVPKPKPVVILSGGLDSAIILYHLLLKTKEEVETYTIIFDKNDDTIEESREVAEYYNVKHKVVFSTDVPSLLRMYEEIIPSLERPNFDLWVYPLAKRIKGDGRETVYAGDGLDEHFGGYWYRNTGYLEDWAECLTYQVPARQTIYKVLGLEYESPILHLDFRKTLKYYDEGQQKTYLREAYRGILPNFILNRNKKRGGIDYWKLWNEGLKPTFPNSEPKTANDVKTLLHVWVSKKWVKNIEKLFKENTSNYL